MTQESKENQIKEPIRAEEAEKLAKELNDSYGIEKAFSLIKDNKVEFIHNKENYRVRMLNQQDKDELDLLRRKKFGELLQDKNILFEKEIIRLYKERGVIDIDDLDKEIKKLWSEINELRMKHGKALEDKEPETILKNYDTQIEECLRKINGIAYQKSLLLENSFERTLEHWTVKMSSWLSLEKEENGNYVRAFDTSENFLKADEELITLTVSFSLALNHNF